MAIGLMCWSHQQITSNSSLNFPGTLLPSIDYYKSYEDLFQSGFFDY